MLTGKKQPCDNLAQGLKTRDIIAKRCGISGSQLEKIRFVRAAAMVNPTLYKPLWDRANRTNKIDKAYRKVKT